jgi:streptogramin lyase
LECCFISRRNCELAGNEAGLLAYYKFNQGAAALSNPTITALTDATPNGNNGLLSSNFALTGTTSNWLAGSPVISGSTIPAAPTAIAQSFCGTATVANLSPAPSANIKWYNVATGGTTLLTTATVTTGTYYVAAVNANGCESIRTMAAITVGSIPNAPLSITPQVYAGTATIASLTATGTNLKWYTTATLGTVLASSTTLVDGTTYFVSQTVGTCESSRTTAVVRKISEATQTFCSAKTIGDLISTPTAGATGQWFTASSGGTALANTDPISTGTYYIEQAIPASISTISSGVSQPRGVAIQADGKIVFTEYFTGNIKRMNANGTSIGVLSNGFSNPFGITIENDGKILVADDWNSNIKRMNTNGSGIVNVGTGFNSPSGVAIQADGKIVVADTFNNAIKRMDADGNNIVTLGSGFNRPRGVAIQGDGKIVVADTDNNTIKRMNDDGTDIQILGSGFSFYQDNDKKDGMAGQYNYFF